MPIPGGAPVVAGRASQAGPGSEREQLLSLITPEFAFDRGRPLPLGATLRRGGINFSVYSEQAIAVTLVLFFPGAREPLAEFPLHPRINRTGNIWHAFLNGLDPGIEYGFRMDKSPNPAPYLHRFNPESVLLDPYARALAGAGCWAEDVPRRWRARVVDDRFDWDRDVPPNIPLADSIIYELHVRGFTRHPSSAVAHPGAFAGLTEKIPYLQALGVTAVELMPVHEFDETSVWRRDPVSGEPLRNYWGYDTVAFFAPKAAYAASGAAGGQVEEFKEMVRQFHEAGIEIILDVVFNHTGEGRENGPTTSFRGLDNSTYYLLDAAGGYHNYSGCGNTMNCNHPVVRDFVLDCLRYWVNEMHVDGFRFDLASILGRGRDGAVLENPPLLERIAADPVLARAKLIAEAWDAAGLYQVGSFPAWGRWAEWNGRFRDDVRRFVRGDPGMVPALATRLAGSADLYHASGRAPCHSINFVTCHDGFTLADLVAYNEKHNERNGEDNRDGCGENLSWNCGAEGPTNDPEVLRLRRRQARNMAALLLLAHGVPMLLAGDEFGRTQGGNNNAWCQDNPTSWIDWQLARQNAGLLRFFERLIALRRRHPCLRAGEFGSVAIEWHGVRLHQPDWSYESRSLAARFSAAGDEMYLIANAYWEPLTFELPAGDGRPWIAFLDTTLEPPADPPPEPHTACTAGPRSVVVLIRGQVT